MKIRIRWADVIALLITCLLVLGGLVWVFVAASDAAAERSTSVVHVEDVSTLP